MKKRILSLLLALTLMLSVGMPVMAAETRDTKYYDIITTGGTAGTATVRFRATCQQDSIPTNYSWSSTMTPLNGAAGFSFYQEGAITKSNHTQYTFKVHSASYARTFTNETIIGGRVEMEAASNAFGRAAKTIEPNS